MKETKEEPEETSENFLAFKLYVDWLQVTPFQKIEAWEILELIIALYDDDELFLWYD